MFFIGIDVGASGAIATLDENSKFVCADPFTNWKDMIKYLGPYQRHLMLVNLEKVHAMPMQGVSSMFTFGANFGGWQALLEANDVPHILTPPQTWQKKILGSFPKGTSKVAALKYVSKRFPELNFPNKKKAEGIVDAICLALYARYIHTNNL